MKKLLIAVLFITSFSHLSFSQEQAKKALDLIQNCDCDEVIIKNNRMEKIYRRHWRESVELKDGFIVFTKGEDQHFWDANNILFIEKTPKIVRIHLSSDEQ